MALTLIFTNAGLERLITAQNDGVEALRIVSVGISETTPAGDAEAIQALTILPDEVKRVATIAGGVVDTRMIHLTVQDLGDDAYSCRAVGLYSDDGILIAVGRSEEAIAEKTPNSALALALDITLLDAIAPGSVSFGDAVFAMPPATRTVRGVVELATPAEAAGRADDERAVTPRGLDAALTPIEAAQRRAGWRTLFLAIAQ